MIEKLLRLDKEELIYFDEIKIHNTLINNIIEFQEILKDFYQNWAKDKNLVNLPKKQIFESIKYDGDFRVMPCIINNPNEIKSVKIIGTNEENKIIKDKICVGKSFLIHPTDNHIFAMFDVCVLSSYRTAAISVFAFDMLYEKNDFRIGIVGVGRIGFYTTLILHEYFGIDEFYCCDNSSKNKQNFLKLVNIYMPQINIIFINQEDLQANCDAVFLATDSKNSILDEKNSNNIKFISSVGADANNLSELDNSVLKDRAIITDSLQSMILGDLKKWQDKNIINQNDLIELKQLKNKTKDKTLFISTGIAVQDALISSFIFDKLS